LDYLEALTVGRLITVVGNTGVGKTTFTHELCRLAPLEGGLESLERRPFQRLFSEHRQRYALANQIDFLTLRAEQESLIRANPRDGIQDGGLDMDYYVFTRLFHQKGYLDRAEFQLCSRVYARLRALLGPPHVIVHLHAPLDVILERFSARHRKLEIAAISDLEAIESLLADWLDGLRSVPVIRVDASQDDPGYSQVAEGVLGQIYQILDGI
jgi:deoxyadenosine/deoxycytidine kinase